MGQGTIFGAGRGAWWKCLESGARVSVGIWARSGPGREFSLETRLGENPVGTKSISTSKWSLNLNLVIEVLFELGVEDGMQAGPESGDMSHSLSHLQTEHPYKSKKAVWHKLLSKQRRRAVVACFRMTPLYNIPT